MKVNNYYKYSISIFLIFQILFWYYTKDITEKYDIVPAVPNTTQVKALSLGDEQLYFRILSLQLQNFGDHYGKTSAFVEYDYEKLIKWFYLLDELDKKSHYVPSIAAYYYSQTPSKPSLNLVIEYLTNTSIADINNKWWWLTQAVLIANYKLKDHKLAAEIAKNLISVEIKIPFWARQMSAIILANDLGDFESSYKIVKHIIANIDDLSEQDINHIKFFLQTQVKYLKNHTNIEILTQDLLEDIPKENNP